ncbi:MAG: SLC13 family permease [Methylophilaceae bacterium]
MDAAKAIKKCPLFKSLGRVELARLSAELEELSLAPNAVLFEKGDAGDAFYIVRSGQAEVYTNGQLEAHKTVLLNAGQVFGEMALLTGEVRSTSVRAHTELQLWCMSAERFFALLAKNRKIALAIEQTLSQRLSEAMQLQSSALDVSYRLLATLGESARRLMVCLAQREKWPARTIEAIRSQDADTANALDQMLSHYCLLSLDNANIVVESSLREVFASNINQADRLWLADLASYLAAAGDIEEAIHIDFLAGKAEPAAQWMIKYGATLRAGCSEEMRQAWLNRLAECGLEDSVLAQARLCLGFAAENAELDEANFSTTIADVKPWWHKIKGAKTLAIVLSLGLILAAWLAPVPEQLTRPAFAALMSIAATVPLLLAEVLPNYIISILLAAAIIVPKIATPAVALSGFSSTSWLLMAMLFALSSAIAESGLMYRLALLMLQRLPGNLIVLTFSLLGLSTVITTGISSSSGRATLAAPSIRDLADAMRLKARSPGAALLGVAGLQMFVGMGSLFITASSTNLLLHGMMPEAYRANTTWLAWLAAALVPHLLLFTMLLPALFLIYRPKISNPVDHAQVNVQLGLLGKITRKERVSIVALGLLGLGFATRPFHGIPDVWTATVVCVMFFATHMLNDRSFQSGINWGVMVYSGVLMGLSQILASLKVDTWLIGIAEMSLHSSLANPYAFVFGVAALAASLRFLVPSKTLSPLMALVAIPLAISVGINPLVAVLAILIAVDHSFFPFLNDAYPTYYHAMGGHLFSDKQARPALQTEFFLRIIALTASVPCWRWMGLIPTAS